ncbi:MAG: Asp23/Gls24 family envelope stress response protein [Candidatus Omnitrophota bacterium]
MKDQTRTDFGTIRIHKKVIASIASIASLEIEGIKRVGGDLKSTFYEILGKKNYGGIKVEIDKNEEVKITVPIVVKYGFNVPEVATRVQENIRRAVEKMTDVSLKDIDISIQAIERG